MAKSPNDKLSRKDRIIQVFNELRADNMEILDEFYDPNLEFYDPISHLKGLQQIKDYYTTMYKNVTDIRFEFHDVAHTEDTYMATWTMHLQSKALADGKEIKTSGISHIRFSPASDKVIYHRDYFDMYEFIYQHIPVIGYLTKKVNQKLSNH